MIFAGLISFLASVIGAVSGIGGGIIIRPLMDMMGGLTVSQISFLSGCTVLAMTMVTLGRSFVWKKSWKRIEKDAGFSTPLALGAAFGGCAGKLIFSKIIEYSGSEAVAGYIQTVLLLLMLVGTILYTAVEERIRTLHVKSRGVSAGIGLILGMQSAFLGIGGGPVNLVVLSFFFSVERKQASLNSLYIIFFSQIFSIVFSVLEKSVPSVEMGYLFLMIAGGITGGIAGSLLYQKMTARQISRMFMAVLVLLVAIETGNLIMSR